MRVSVLIATYNRAALLDHCLDHLGLQPFGPGDEVIIVDNGSTDDTAEVVAAHQQTFPTSLQYDTESRPGKSHALARAQSMARGGILIFIDDDVEVGRGWLDAIRDAMRDRHVSLVGGRVVPRWERDAPWWLKLNEGPGRVAAPLALLDYGPNVIPLAHRTVLGANMAVRHDVIRKLGGFASHLGKLRGTLLSGEDQELCRRVQAAGLTALYVPTAVVRHWVPASRLRLGYCLRWFFWSGITNATLDEGDPQATATVVRVPRYLVRQFLAGCVMAPALAMGGRVALAVDRTIDIAFAAGYAASRWGVIRRAGSPHRPSTAGQTV